MDEALAYLKESLGITGEAEVWSGIQELPLFLRASTKIWLVHLIGCDFLLIRSEGSDLPSIKRAYRQMCLRVQVPVAMCVPAADARQRKTLAAHGIPFICPHKQVFLPFLGMASREWGQGRTRPLSEKLSSRAQRAAIWGVLTQSPYTLADLREATGMNAPHASATVGELVDRGLAMKERRGRRLYVTPIDSDALLAEHMELLSSPVLRTMLVRKTPQVEALPDAGETALAARGMLAAPRVAEKAAPRSAVSLLKEDEVLDGELPNDHMVRVQIWRYAPLFTGREGVDLISLALSFVDTDDERIWGEVQTLFGRGYQWEKAR